MAEVAFEACPAPREDSSERGWRSRGIDLAPYDRCVSPVSGPVDRKSASEAKIALFRSLFRGRDDAYPRRFESRKTGKTGYAPACANEWVRGICEKPRIKCTECSHRRFLAVTDQVIRWHLSGRDGAGQPFVAGVYPLLFDEACCPFRRKRPPVPSQSGHLSAVAAQGVGAKRRREVLSSRCPEWGWAFPPE